MSSAPTPNAFAPAIVDSGSILHWPLDGRPSYAWSLVPTPSKTVDQALPPDGMGKAGAFTG